MYMGAVRRSSRQLRRTSRTFTGAKSSGATIDPITKSTTTDRSTGTYRQCPPGQVVMKTIRGKFGARDTYVCGIPQAPRPRSAPPPPPPPPPANIITDIKPVFQQSFTPQVSPNIQVSTGSGSQTAGTSQQVKEKQQALTPPKKTSKTSAPAPQEKQILPFQAPPVQEPAPLHRAQAPLQDTYYSGGGGYDAPAYAPEPATETVSANDKESFLSENRLIIGGSLLVVTMFLFYMASKNNGETL